MTQDTLLVLSSCTSYFKVIDGFVHLQDTIVDCLLQNDPKALDLVANNRCRCSGGRFANNEQGLAFSCWFLKEEEQVLRKVGDDGRVKQV